MIRDDEAKEKLVNTAIDLIKNEKRQEELKANIGKLAITDADEVVAKEILEVIKKQK
jgi:UDP-N-acetylglucosamine--N-acetylmuramyl-(pentapeptide) pyrophosphoryl-undecaprenol N-acetylglucosamine transferase